MNIQIASSGLGSRRSMRAARLSAFTMIEIAISLAVIGFALVAIIGILPTGLNVQRDNREQTIINQDLTVFMDAIRNGSMGLDDLTNYVAAITNYTTLYQDDPKGGGTVEWGYTYTNSTINKAPSATPYPIINGTRIVGLLSTPKYVVIPSSSKNGAIWFRSNYVVAFVRAISGSASEKAPQTNASVRELSFNYRLIAEMSDYGTNYYHPLWTNFHDPVLYGTVPNVAEITARSNQWLIVNNIQTNADFHDLRLTFRWPLLANGGAGNGRQVFRAVLSGQLRATNEATFPQSDLFYTTWFLNSRTYSSPKP
jgi:type II secretory pathway pseudopilin PulG